MHHGKIVVVDVSFMASIIYHGPGKALWLMYHSWHQSYITVLANRCCWCIRMSPIMYHGPGKSLSLMYHSPGKIFVVDVSMYHHGINQQHLRAALAPVHFYLRRMQEFLLYDGNSWTSWGRRPYWSRRRKKDIYIGSHGLSSRRYGKLSEAISSRTTRISIELHKETSKAFGGIFAESKHWYYEQGSSAIPVQHVHVQSWGRLDKWWTSTTRHPFSHKTNVGCHKWIFCNRSMSSV